MKKILVVDDEKKIADIVKAYLEKDGFQVAVAYDGKQALEMVKSQFPDLVILDIMLPKVSGWDVCRNIRSSSAIPIIMLTARDDTSDKILGLELGADDYVTKPFDPKELVSRVRAVLRRYEGKREEARLINIGGLSINTDNRTVRCGNKPVELTATEFDLLKTLAENPGRVFSRMQLLDKVQGEAFEGYERTIDSHIKNIRRKIELEPDNPRLVITVHGVGYKMQEDNAKS
jgi:DNA-binding response OmpR family regulator